jgi:acetyltransferase-like isoleucine patch superfamily enzyme
VHKSEDIDLCAQTRQIVQEGIDWPCKVKYLFRNENLGCGLAVSGAIDWFFEHVECGIILEDDCLPGSSFFSFCEEMLIKYADVENIGAVSGTNFFNSISGADSYAFSKYGGVWGWATWKRAWIHFDLKILNKQDFQDIDFNFISKSFQNENQVTGLKKLFESVVNNRELVNSTWDFQWFFIRLKNNLLSIVPAVNLINNIGLKGGAHFKTDQDYNEYSPFDVKALTLPEQLVHPKKIDVDHDLDDRFGDLYSWTKHNNKNNYNNSQKKYFAKGIFVSTIIKLRNVKYKLLSSRSISVHGKPTCIQPLLLEGNGEVIFENGVFIGTRESPDFFSSYAYVNIRNNGLVKFGHGVWTNNKLAIISNGGEITIGRDTLIGYNVCIINSDFHHLSYLRRKEVYKNFKNIYIGDNVFIGNNVQILKGSIIGNNSIIGAGSIVLGNIPENSIFCGGKLKQIHINA